MSDARLLSVDAAAAYLSVSKRTVRAWISNGDLVPVRLPSVRHRGERNRRVLLDRTDLDRFVDQRKVVVLRRVLP
jgi:excisionase family DNA binding protein